MSASPPSPKRLLFICTGNFYRSRFAEAVFNHLAEERGLCWWAFSRGLAIHWAEGYISEHTRQALADRGIELRHTGPGRVQLSEADLRSADLIVALKDEEHRPMLACMFPEWTSKIVFWDVSDLPHSPEVALPAIEREVRKLAAELERAEATPPGN
jgi:protein-tyrosine phosphatase